MRGIEQRAIGAVVDVELVAAALLDPDDQRGVFGAQRPARFAPQFGVVGDRQASKWRWMIAEIILERRRLHARIDARGSRRRHRSCRSPRRPRRWPRARAPAPGHRRYGVIAWLPTWKQMPSQSATWRVACSSGSRIGQVDAELGGEAELGIFRRHAQAHAAGANPSPGCLRHRWSPRRSSPAPRPCRG